MKRKGIIEFVDMSNEMPKELYPRPAKNFIPDWYKNTSSYKKDIKEAYMDERGFSSATIKKCMPVFDAMTAGYILVSPSDVQVSGSSINKKFTWPSKGTIEWHARWQVGEFPGIPESANNLPKWMNPWSIRTAPGYSCMFLNPMNRNDSKFTCFEGIVDTDKFYAPVNFPFYLNDESWNGIIPAGTPIIQVIPFKRESYQHTISCEKDSNNSSNIKKVTSMIDSIFFNAYKNFFWQKKEYN